jgi:hypothetical protein
MLKPKRIIQLPANSLRAGYFFISKDIWYYAIKIKKIGDFVEVVTSNGASIFFDPKADVSCYFGGTKVMPIVRAALSGEKPLQELASEFMHVSAIPLRSLITI